MGHGFISARGFIPDPGSDKAMDRPKPHPGLCRVSGYSVRQAPIRRDRNGKFTEINSPFPPLRACRVTPRMLWPTVFR